MIRLLTGFFLLAGFAFAADKEAERQVIDAVQKTFDVLAAKDEAGLRKLFLPDARLIAMRNGKVSSTPIDQFASRIATMQEPILERMWTPKVLVEGKIGVLWAEYDFHRSGKFSHCGIDVVNLLKTEEGWMISSIQYTVETEGCKPSPLGPPKQ